MSILGTEADFENLIVDSLLNVNKYIKEDDTKYDKQTALLNETLISFVKQTQKDNWKKLNTKFGCESDVVSEFLSTFYKKREKDGILSVFRNGISVRGINFDIVYWKPDNKLNVDTEKLYKKNIFTVINQLRTSKLKANTHDKTAIPDIVLFLNGIPIVTVELKYTPAGQSYLDAEQQYKDRNPQEPLFRFKYGSLVYFAVDESYVSMTTKLNGENTYFLPFNMGSNGAGNVGGAGNPDAPVGKQNTYYLWEHVFAKDSLLDILQSFLTIEVDEKTKQETLIFPRFQQLDVVNKLLADVKKNGSSKNYLIEHSAGSGKSNTIAWLAFHLQNLYFPSGSEKIFDSIIILNDRRVLDKQTRATIQSFNPKAGTVIEAKKSTDIIDGIKTGNVIIISTLQKFPVIYKKLVAIVKKNPGKRYAVIADEAHQSQSGNAAGKLKIGLSTDVGFSKDATGQIYTKKSDKGLLIAADSSSINSNTEYDEVLEEDNVSEVLDDEASVKEQEEVLQEIAKGKQKNISFFAFTATPTRETLQMFGVPENNTTGGNGKGRTFRAFHVYSMQQAIEEKFILDVLVNYTTYKQYFELSVKQNIGLQYDEQKLLRETIKLVKQHEYRIQRMVEYIYEHFESIGSKTIAGKGKAMIVTSSRKEAVMYTKILRDYLKHKNHSDWGVLVAISGEIDNLTESDYNSFPKNSLCKNGSRITESQTAATFHGDEYRFLVVADKYQTGFSEKLLSCMYVDKKLHDIKAVQTLSRLNRTMGGDQKRAETDCFVVDFVNKREDIQASFQKFYGDIRLLGEITLKDLYDAQTAIDNCGLVMKIEIDEFAKLYNQKLVAQNAQNINKIHQLDADLNKLCAKLITRFKVKPQNEQDEFYDKCRDFTKKFLFLQNIVSITDSALVYFGLYICAILNPLKLSTKVNSVIGNNPIDITKLLTLSSYRIDDKITGSIKLCNQKNATVNPINTGAGTNAPPAITTVHKLVTELNNKHGTDFTDADIVPVVEVFKKSFEDDSNFHNETIVSQPPLFDSKYNGKAGDAVISITIPHIDKKFANLLYQNQDFYNDFKKELRFPVYEHLKKVLNIA